MGGCLLGHHEGGMTERKIIKLIKKSSDSELLRYMNNYCGYTLAQQYRNFMGRVRENYQEIGDSDPHRPQQNMTYHQQLVHYTTELMKLVKKCDEVRDFMEEEYQRAEKEYKKKRELWKEDQDRLRSNPSKMGSQIVANMKESQRQVDQQQYINQQIERRKSNIINSLIAPQNQITTEEKKDLVTTQVNGIIECYQKENQALKNRIHLLNEESNNILMEETHKHKKAVADFSDQVYKLKQQLKNNQEKLTQSENECKELRIKMASLKSLQTTTTMDHVQELQKKEHKQSFTSSVNFKRFLNSKVVFNEYEEGKEYRQKIDAIFDPVIIYGSRLLFSYDKIRPNNMFEYVKAERSLLFLGRLSNGYVVGGFSKCGFKDNSRQIAGNYCFIFSISPNGTSHKLELKSQSMAQHSVKLDKDYLKFGANEIRVSCGSNQVRSIIKTKACIYECKQNPELTLQQFLGVEQQNYKIEQYEIFELQLMWSSLEVVKKKPVQSQLCS